MPPTYILGLSAFYHDSAAALLQDGEVIAAAQEERFTRIKGDASFPTHAIEFCLRKAGISVDELHYVGFYDKPFLKFERILETYLGVVPRGFRSFSKAVPLWVREKLKMEKQIRKELGFQGSLLYAEHHQSHAASAFFPSPFQEAAILTMDGVGEWATSTMGYGEGGNLELSQELHWPDSLGLLYSAFTFYTGFKVNSGEYKVMGLAPYGEPKYVDLIYRELLDLREDGSFRLNQSYFNYLSGLTMTSAAFHDLFGGPPRTPESRLTQREMDLARSIQEVCEEVMLRMARHAHRITGSRNLCLAGGVALNCVGNGRILREGPFEQIWIQPAAGDAGGALGVSLMAWHRYLGNARPLPHGESRLPREGDPFKEGPLEEGRSNPVGAGAEPGCASQHAPDGMKGSYLGPDFSPDEVETALREAGAHFHRLDESDLLEETARLLAEEKVVGWFQGPMEFGPRALGARSILGDPRSPRMQAQMNLKIKFRESFRPFAPSILRERVADWFELESDSPYMLLVAPVKEERRLPMGPDDASAWGIERLNIPRSSIPAVTHVDHSARVQTVSQDTNPRYHALLKCFEARTGCPVLVNTSFNVRGEPIVCSPTDAYRCFMRTELDALVVWPFLLRKEEQPEGVEDESWKAQYQLD